MQPSLSPYRYLYFFEFVITGVYIAYFNLYLADSLGFSKQTIGVLLAIPLIAKCVVPLFWGDFADRRGFRLPLLRGAYSGCLIIFSGFAYLRDLPEVALALVVFSLIGTITIPFLEALTFQHLQDRIDLYPRAKLWGPIGFLVAVVGLGLIIEVTSLRVIFWVLSGAYLALFGLSFSISPHLDETAPAAQARLPLRRMLLQPGVAWFFGIIALLRFSDGPLAGYFSIYLSESGYGAAAIGMVIAVSVVTEVLGHRFLFARLLRRPFSVLFMICALLSAAKSLCLALPPHPMVIVFSMALHGVSFGLGHVAAILQMQRLFPPAHRTLGQALFSGIYYGLGGGLGTVVSGMALAVLSFREVFAVAGILALGIGWMSLRARPPTQQ